MNSLTFDKSKFYLGVLCRRGHDYNGTGKSLRHVIKNGTGNCLECKGRNHATSRITDSLQLANLGIDSNTFYLGRLCSRNHEYLKTGKTLRKLKAKCCIECHKLKTYESRRNNPVRNRMLSLEQHHKHREKRLKVMQKWRQNNPDWQKEYRRTDKGKNVCKIYEHKRRALKTSNHSCPYTYNEITQRFQDFNNCCAYCGAIATSIDHVIPISKGGADAIGNLLPCCRSCNSSKGCKDVEQWYISYPSYTVKRWRKILKVLGLTEATLGQLSLF